MERPRVRTTIRTTSAAVWSDIDTARRVRTGRYPGLFRFAMVSQPAADGA
jgi:hypothetical protein